jgi:hypothetical protein
MKRLLTSVCGTAIVLALATTGPVSAQQSAARSLTMPVTGTAPGNSAFSGTLTINRFVQRNNQVVAIGFVNGVLSRDGRIVGSALGQVAWPVAVRTGGIAAVKGQLPGTSGIRQIADSRVAEPAGRFVLAQAETCPVLDIALGAANVNLLGVNVALAPVGLTLNGESGTPLGDLVCAVSGLLGNVAGLVNLLNNILGLLTGLLGGLTGGIGGVLP